MESGRRGRLKEGGKERNGGREREREKVVERWREIVWRVYCLMCKSERELSRWKEGGR